jgi:transcriptional regulator of arginine metabolism
MRDKRLRQNRLLQIVKERDVRNQNEIIHRFMELGVPVTQASVSRDIRELGLVKVGGRYATPAAVTATSGQGNGSDLGLAGLIRAVRAVGANLIIVQTPAGEASSVAVTIDQQQLSDVAGTVAGDDTIFVAVPSRAAQGRVLATLKSWAGI